jgi:hypothetical protein
MSEIDYEATFRIRCAEMDRSKAEMAALRYVLIDVLPVLSFRARWKLRKLLLAHRFDMALWRLYVVGARVLFGWTADPKERG